MLTALQFLPQDRLTLRAYRMATIIIEIQGNDWLACCQPRRARRPICYNWRRKKPVPLSEVNIRFVVEAEATKRFSGTNPEVVKL
jgi:hypothetical protein